jgi:hypothetical protein
MERSPSCEYVPQAFLVQRGLHGRRRLAKVGMLPIRGEVGPKNESWMPPRWARMAITSERTFISGAFQYMSNKNVQRCLDKFCRRFSRRIFPLGISSRLVNACALSSRIIVSELIA